MTLQEFFWAFGYYSNDTSKPFDPAWVACEDCVSDIERVQRDLAQIKSGLKLYADVVNQFGIKDNKQLEMVKEAMLAAQRKLNWIKPDELIAWVLNPMGFYTWEAFEKWISGGSNADLSVTGYNNIINPRCPDLGDLETISVYDMRYKVRLATGIHPFKFETSDTEYRLLPKAKVQELLDACPSSKLPYVKEKNDCDDFSNAMIGWMVDNLYGNVTLGRINATLRQRGGNEYVHAFNWALLDTGQVIFIEPQRDLPGIDWFVYGEECTFSGVEEIVEIIWMRI